MHPNTSPQLSGAKLEGIRGKCYIGAFLITKFITSDTCQLKHLKTGKLTKPVKLNRITKLNTTSKALVKRINPPKSENLSLDQLIDTPLTIHDR